MRSGSKTKRSFWLGFIVILILVTGLLKPVQELWWSGTRGVQGWFWQTGYYLKWWWQTPALVTERDSLLAQKNQWLTDQAKLLNLQREKDSLEQALKFLSAKNFNYLGTRVMAEDQFNERLLIVDRGQRDGLTQGQPLVNEQGVVLGKVTEVNPDRASILLLNDPKSELAVAIEGTPTLGLVSGSLGGGLAINYIPLEISLKVGQLVYTSGLETVVPAGLAVGQIVAVHKETGDLFQTAEVQSLINFQEINRGWIIK